MQQAGRRAGHDQSGSSRDFPNPREAVKFRQQIKLQFFGRAAISLR
jgi:hypothetical protein